MFILMLSAGLSYAATPMELAVAMEIPATDIAGAVTGGSANTTTLYNVLGTISPTSGADMAYLYTGSIGVPPQTGTDLGSYGTPGDETSLTLNLSVPLGINSFSFDFYFLSAEYPEWLGSSYNDTFEANVGGTAWSGNAAIDSLGNTVSINSVLFSVINSADLMGTGFEGGVGGGTGWLTVLVPVDALTGVELDFRVYDVYDGIYDSSVALDNFRWSETDIPEPFIIETIGLKYLVPKRGSIEGGEQTTIYGTKFNGSCLAFFDGTAALTTTFIDSEMLEATVPAHAEGLIDVTVECMGTDAKLIGGYTYYDVDAGELPPLITGVDPYEVSSIGGESVLVVGEDFVDGATAMIDGESVDTIFVSDTELLITTLPHPEGLTSVSVTNPSGLADYAAASLLFYYEKAYVDPVDTGDTGDTDAGGGDLNSQTGGCGCSAGGLAAGGVWSLGLFGLALLRREVRS
jgi:hypothetical protein